MNINLTYINKLRRIFRFSPHDISTDSGRSDERYRRIFLTGGSTFFVKMVTLFTGLITVPLTLNYLGPERYGLWMTISSLIVFISFADMGLGNGLLNAISKANGKDNIEEAQSAVTSAFTFLTCLSVIFLVLFFIFNQYVPWEKVFNVQSEIAVKESGPTMMVLICIFLINMPLGVIRRIYMGYQEDYRFQTRMALGSIIGLVGVLISIYFKAGLPWLVLAFMGGPLLTTILNGLILFVKERNYLIPKPRYFNFTVGKQLIKTGAIFFLLQLFTLIGNSSDNIIIAQMFGPSEVAKYAIVKKLFMFVLVTQYVIQPLWPAFGEAVARGDYKWAKNTLRKGLVLCIGSGAILALPLLVFGKYIITIWVGVEFIPSYLLLSGFYVFVFLSNYGGVMSTFLSSGSLVTKQTLMIGLASITALFLKIFLSDKIGISGIVWATVIGYGLFYIVPAYRLAFGAFKNK